MNESLISQSDLVEKETASLSENQLNTSNIDINKFGTFTLKIDHVPSLLGKKLLETLWIRSFK